MCDTPLCPRCQQRLRQNRNLRRVELVCDACKYQWDYTAKPEVESIADAVSVNGVDVPPFVREMLDKRV